jgi:hypothetical protein
LSSLAAGSSIAAEAGKNTALCAAAGVERGRVLVLVHEEELAVAEALGFAGLA